MLNDHDRIAELLCAFLDGELDGTEAETLFSMLAHSEELQAEMRRLIALNTGFRRELLAPPSHLFGEIERRLSPAPPAPATASPLHRITSARPLLVLLGAVAGALLTLLATALWQKTVVPAQTAVQRPLHSSASPSPRPDHTPAQRQVAQQMPVHTADGNRTDLRTSQPGTGPQLRPDATRHTLPADRPAVQVEHRDTTANRTPLHITPSSLLASPPPQRVQRQVYASATVQTSPQEAGLSSATPDDAHGERVFSLHLRRFSARSYPDFDVDPLTTPTLNNVGVGLYHSLSKEHSIGVEIGQENLLQRYSDNDGRTTVEQNYLAFWAGVSYRYSYDAGTLRPFVQTLLGGARTGPLGRALLGVEYRTGAVALSAGVEGTLHLYTYGDTWYSARKLGISYGLSFHF